MELVTVFLVIYSLGFIGSVWLYIKFVLECKNNGTIGRREFFTDCMGKLTWVFFSGAMMIFILYCVVRNL